MKIFLFLFLVWPHVSRGAENPQLVYQTEAAIDISGEFAARILGSGKFKAKDRMDYHLEIYDGQNFRLLTSSEQFKLRLKKSDHKSVLQATGRGQVSPQTCPEGWSFVVRKKQVGELALDEFQTSQFTDNLVEQMNLIQTEKGEEVAASVKEFHNFFRVLPLPLLDTLAAVPGHGRWFFVGTHFAEKKKWKRSVDLGRGSIEVSVAEAKDHIGNLFVQQKYEVEFEIENPISLEDFSHSVCVFLRQLKPAAKDLGVPQKRAAPITLNFLKRFNEQLEL